MYSGDRLALGTLGVGYGVMVTFHSKTFSTPRVSVDETGDALDSTAAGQAPDGGPGDTLDVGTQDLTVALSSTINPSPSPPCHGLAMLKVQINRNSKDNRGKKVYSRRGAGGGQPFI